MSTFSVPTISRSTVISVASFDFIDNLIAKTISRTVDTNVATIVCDRAHFRLPGEIVYVTNMGDATYNGYYKITAIPSIASFSYALTHANEVVTADLAGEIKNPMEIKTSGFYLRAGAGNLRYSSVGQVALQTATKKIDTNVATITTQKDHGLKVGNTIIINGCTGAHAADYNAAFTVTVINSPRSFSFALVHADDAENADSSGVVDDTIVKTVGASAYFIDPETVRKVHVTGTTATGVVIGYSPKQ